MRADRDVDGIVLVLDVRERDVTADGGVRVHLDAGRQDKFDIRVQLFLRQTVIRDAVAQHTAELRALVIDDDLVAHQGQEVRRGQTARAAADDGDALACARRARRRCLFVA